MLRHKKSRDKGRFSFTRFFQKFQPGDSVAVVKELSQIFGYSNRIQGKTGKIIRKRGSAYEIELNDINKSKTYFLHPVHLKRIEDVK